MRAELSWRVVAAGRGSLGTQPPDLLLEFFRSRSGSSSYPSTTADPAASGPLSVSGDVHPASVYLVRIKTQRLCGGCRIEYALTITHPADGFAAFGRVVKGMDVVRRIQRAPADGQALTPPVPVLSARRARPRL